MRDLELVYDYLGEKPAETALLQFLAKPCSAQQRCDVMQAANSSKLNEFLHLQNLPRGRWPSSPAHLPAFAQQLALNLYLGGKYPLFAVNGAPGTGKTTLVRDLLAHLVTERALVLSKFSRPQDALSTNYQTLSLGRRSYRFRTLAPQLCGYELLIASNNNAAVENISLQLPKKSSLSPEQEDFGYLQAVSRLYHHVLNETASPAKQADLSTVWGFPSAALGNSRNRRRFCRALFYFSKDENEEETSARIAEGKLLTLYEWRKKALPGPISFHQAKIKLKEAKKLYDEWLSAQEVQSPPKVEAALNVRSKSYQQHAPGITEQGNILRSGLFLAALQLHEAWVREVPQLETELFALSLLLRAGQYLEQKEAVELWRLLFMIFPCVSTTLASVERMCASMPPGCLGHAVIEEAGQATPQSVLGVLMRSKRAMIIGDERQLEPVVIIPDALERCLAEGLEPALKKRFSPLSSSAQAVADTLNPFGTLLQEEGGSGVWLGCPLYLHRRCSSPMFEIANSIAYGGMMIQGAEEDVQAGALGQPPGFK